MTSVLAISHLPRVDLRVLVLFWHFADRWGKVRGEEVTVSIPLTHLNIARLVGSRRPTVTTALRRLGEAGLVVQNGKGSWVLRGGPPTQLHGLSQRGRTVPTSRRTAGTREATRAVPGSDVEQRVTRMTPRIPSADRH